MSSTLLDLLASGVSDPRSFEWFEAPSDAMMKASQDLLDGLGAIEPGSGELTGLGQKMVQLPLHPRHARIVLEAIERGETDLGVKAAAS